MIPEILLKIALAACVVLTLMRAVDKWAAWTIWHNRGKTMLWFVIYMITVIPMSLVFFILLLAALKASWN